MTQQEAFFHLLAKYVLEPLPTSTEELLALHKKSGHEVDAFGNTTFTHRDDSLLVAAAANLLLSAAKTYSIPPQEIVSRLGIRQPVVGMRPMRLRGFESVRGEHNKNLGNAPTLPTRASAQSAGYDIYSSCGVVLEAGESAIIFTDVKAYMRPGEVLMVYPRSSLGKKGLQLLNTVGVIDADYYGNPDNDGNIGLMIRNAASEPLVIRAGDRIAQGIFMPYLVADGDDVQAERAGGFGSSGS